MQNHGLLPTLQSSFSIGSVRPLHLRLPTAYSNRKGHLHLKQCYMRSFCLNPSVILCAGIFLKWSRTSSSIAWKRVYVLSLTWNRPPLAIRVVQLSTLPESSLVSSSQRSIINSTNSSGDQKTTRDVCAICGRHSQLHSEVHLFLQLSAGTQDLSLLGAHWQEISL